MRILVTGRDGQVARALVERTGGDLTVEAVGRPDLDITDRVSIDRAIERYGPDVLVNAAAFTAVDRAETEREMAFAANCVGAGNAAAAAASAHIPIIHVSTDYVFPGDKAGPYTEGDPTGPRSVYGHSKLDGEAAVAVANPTHTILRTAWVYSPWGANFLKTMLRLAKDRNSVRVVADQTGTPTYAPDIAEAILRVAERMTEDLDGTDWRGVFHMTAAGDTTWAGFAEEIFRVSTAGGGPGALVERIPTSEYPTPARRPANSVLDNTRFQQVFGYRLPDWSTSIPRCLQALKNLDGSA